MQGLTVCPGLWSAQCNPTASKKEHYCPKHTGINDKGLINMSCGKP